MIDRYVSRPALAATYLAVVTTLFLAASSIAQPYVFWNDAGANTIGRANVDGTGVNTSLLSGLNASGLFATDTHIWWSSNGNFAPGGGLIGRANLDGTNPDTIVTGLYQPSGVAVNSSYIFWTTAITAPNAIGRADLDGSNVNTSLVSVINQPTTVFGIAANETHIFWGNCGATGTGTIIGRAEVDGTNVNHSLITGASCAVGPVVTPTHLFWANAASTTIGRSNVDGTSASQTFVTGANRPGGAAPGVDYLFWSNQNTATIGRANINGSSANQSFITGLSFPIAITTAPVPVVLPVELAAFEVLLDGRTAVLLWKTASELNNAGFAIQHVDPARPEAGWQTKGFVAGAGTTFDPQAYDFVIADLDPGLHAFRLKQIDFDGSFEYSDVTEATLEVPGTHFVSMPSPNPFNRISELTLTVAEEQRVRVDLFEATGRHVRVVFDETVSEARPTRIILHAEGLPSGVYFYRLSGVRFSDGGKVVYAK